jgi:hypothetical protein
MVGGLIRRDMDKRKPCEDTHAHRKIHVAIKADIAEMYLQRMPRIAADKHE